MLIPFVSNERGISKMIDLSNVKHHPVISEITELLCNKTQNTDQGFFKVEIAYFLAKMASCMRAQVNTKDRGLIPVNLYVLDLSESGYSVGILENDLVMGFKKKFVEETMPMLAEQHIWELATEIAVRRGTDQDTEYNRIKKYYTDTGNYPFTFDSGTSAAVKQLRQQLLIAACGSINFQCDEIGSNLVGSTELMNTYLEMYDQGLLKQKLTKNTAENVRSIDIDGKTPANMLLFGTPVKLLDGGQTEDLFYSFLETGYARRCLFGMGKSNRKAYHSMTASEIYHKLIQPQNDQMIQKWSTHFDSLADPAMYNWTMDMPDDVAIKLLQYRIDCERIAESLPEHEEIQKAELSHRYFKALKLAGAYAFIDKSMQVTEDHLLQAIKLVEESGKSFESILTREKAYMKLAKYLAEVKNEVTHADLTEALPFYKSSATARNELMTLAQAWGYKQHIIIKKSFADGVELFKGEALQKTDLNKMILSWSDHWAYNYHNEYAPFDQLPTLTQAKGLHWSNHHFNNNHRAEENALPPFNMIVVDVDGTISLDQVYDLLKDYKFMTYTTKRHTANNNRFRLIIPMNYTLKMDSADYKEFMNNVLKWLPFESDESANQRAKKWESFDGGSYRFNDGEVLDVLPFIPRTSRNEQYQQKFSQIENMSALERWFAERISQGNRNNNMIKYALALVDGGMDLPEVAARVKSFNKQLKLPLAEEELETTILKTVAKKIEEKQVN